MSLFDNEKQKEIVMEIYRRMFKRAEPSADIDEIIKSGEGKQRNFFLKYYLPQDIQDKITKEVLDEYKVKDKRLRQSFLNEVVLGSSPTGNKETQKRYLQKLKKPEVKNE